MEEAGAAVSTAEAEWLAMVAVEMEVVMVEGLAVRRAVCLSPL